MSHYDCPCMEKCPLHWAMSRIGGKWKVQGTFFHTGAVVMGHGKLLLTCS